MSFKLAVFNPSNYQRGGYVVTPWNPIYEQTKIPPDKIVLTDDKDNRLKCQVDAIDPSDPSLDTLVFFLSYPIKPGPENYSCPSTFINITEGDSNPDVGDEPYGDPGSNFNKKPNIKTPYGKNGIKLSNERLEIWFNLTPHLDPGLPNEFSGAATSVLLDGKELIDSTNIDWLFHSREKRCMQINQFQLTLPAWEMDPDPVFNLFDQPYEIIKINNGQLRANCTIASIPFHYKYIDHFADEEKTLICKLYRVISLYPGADYLYEEVFVKAEAVDESRSKTIYMKFVPEYFMHLAFGHRPPHHRFDYVPDWLAVGSHLTSHPGIGFATDVHTAPIIKEDESHRFTWKLLPCSYAKCIHIFMRNLRKVDDKAGHYWYENIFKPLRAEMKGD